MAGQLPECIIVSANRFNDIQPYASHIYQKDPKTWDAVFPWEFPQKASKNEEEIFLRSFFSETEIHMNGGAYAPGNGFRFLKQVWYCIALWNLEHRVPAVESWFWQQPDSMELLKDPTINAFFFKPDVQPATFFKKAELDMYGEKFLSKVIPRIQQTAKVLLEQEQKAEEHIDATNGAAVVLSDNAPTSLGSVVHESTRGAQNTLPNDHANKNAAQAKMNESNANGGLQDSRLPTSENMAGHPGVRDTARVQSFQPDLQVHHRKRGYSGGKRGNNRGGHFQPRPPLSFNDHHQHPPTFSSPVYASTNQAYHLRPTQAGGPFNVLHPLPQGQPLAGAPPPLRYIPGQHRDAMPPQQNMTQHFSPGPHPQPLYYYNHNNIHDANDRGHGQFVERGFSGQFYPPPIEEAYSGRGGHRRDSQGSRGGKPRAFSGNRGRGGRGRSSFAASDRPPVFNPGFDSNRKSSNDLTGSAFPFKARRGSIIGEKNWRSGSEHPQTQENEQHMKENSYPGRTFSGSFHPPPVASMPYPNHSGEVRQSSYEPGLMPPIVREAQSFPPAVPTSAIEHETTMRMTDIDDAKPATLCDKHWIGKDCTPVTKLIVFDIPASISEQEIVRLFSQYAPIAGAKRHVPKLVSFKHANSDPLVFVSFNNHLDARRVLDDKALHLLDGRPIRVEVPREFWDYQHVAFNERWPYGFGILPDVGAANNFANASDLSQAPVLLHRIEDAGQTPRSLSMDRQRADEVQSEDTTPTPSGASTPKQNKNKNKHKNKNKKKPDGLRKTSLAVSTDQRLQTEKGNEHSDAASVLNTTESENRVPIDPSINGDAGTRHDSVATHDQQHSPDQTAAQTSSEPSFTPTENIKTSLPQPETSAVSVEIEALLVDKQRSASGNNEVQIASTPTVSLTEDVTVTELPVVDAQNAQPFREEQKTAEKTQATNADSSLTSDTKAQNQILPILNAETPLRSEDHVDDSFHTASGTPDSAKDDETRRASALQGTAPFTAKEVLMQPEETSPPAIDSNAGKMTETPIASPDASDVAARAKDKKVHIPQLPPKPKVAISIPFDARVDNLHPGNSYTPGNSAVPPTPAFVTAPNTPSVIDATKPDENAKPPTSDTLKGTQQDRDAQSETCTVTQGTQKDGEAEPNQAASKKVDKPRGPAQTESLSLFGRKKEKKPKPPKKGTLKGKPSQMDPSIADVTSAGSSRVTSGAATPNLNPTARKSSNTERSHHGDGNMPWGDSKNGEVAMKQQTSEEGSKTDAANALGTVDGTPTKSRGGKFGSFIVNMFGGGQQSQSLPKESKGEEGSSSKGWLTGSKAPHHPPNTEIKQTDRGDSAPTPSASGEGCVADEVLFDSAADKLTNDKEVRRASTDIEKKSVPMDQTKLDVSPGVGLGITNPKAEHEAGVEEGEDVEMKAKAKKAKKKPRKKKKESEISNSISSEGSTPSNQPGPNLEMFQFGQSLIVAHDQEDNRSERSSSRTLSAETPSSEMQSPMSTVPRVRFPAKPSSNLVQAKLPSWRYKKRTPSAKVQESVADEDADEEVTYLIPLKDGSDDNGQISQSGQATPSSSAEAKHPGRMFLYFGPGARDEMRDAQGETLQEDMQIWVRDELKRKYDIGSISEVAASEQT